MAMHHIEVIYGTFEKQTICRLIVMEGTTVGEVIAQSGIGTQWPEVDFTALKLGIFGHFVTAETLVRNNDRVEIYRPLLIDPKDARKVRAMKIEKAPSSRDPGFKHSEELG